MHVAREQPGRRRAWSNSGRQDSEAPKRWIKGDDGGGKCNGPYAFILVQAATTEKLGSSVRAPRGAKQKGNDADVSWWPQEPDWSEEETDNPLLANDRNFYKVEK